MCYFCHAQLFEITRVANIKSTLVQHSCRNAEVVEAFCPVAASRSNTRRSIHQPPVAELHAPAELPTALSSVHRYADIARRLASRLPSRAAPTCDPHSARCSAGAQLPATSCLGAFWTPVSWACLDPCHCRRPKTCTQADIRLMASRTEGRILMVLCNRGAPPCKTLQMRTPRPHVADL